mmetsp:Transcript_44972/g.89024  ORF Transcript_44972/g.89024 Transcript_44972/m.89024 type:complete len:603 (-) Transcript_44972:42-1850(-)|eukprot:CAMPEP_0172723392 /NCGR_PEP_ID=MMETSP1074-20121228/83648_1 /TAXON_ID=2916 /ORGANISM="Ceratium fusus, Strain PA161109" /LENGTH=602 /DNA_ID=CAMNT_0013549621 /DNA_START=149 /DNA_END=1957 /DNA_ORIENTATION=-
MAEQRSSDALPAFDGSTTGSSASGVHRLSRGLLQAGLSRLGQLGPRGRSVSLNGQVGRGSTRANERQSSSRHADLRDPAFKRLGSTTSAASGGSRGSAGSGDHPPLPARGDHPSLPAKGAGETLQLPRGPASLGGASSASSPAAPSSTAGQSRLSGDQDALTRLTLPRSPGCPSAGRSLPTPNASRPSTPASLSGTGAAAPPIASAAGGRNSRNPSPLSANGAQQQEIRPSSRQKHEGEASILAVDEPKTPTKEGGTTAATPAASNVKVEKQPDATARSNPRSRMRARLAGGDLVVSTKAVPERQWTNDIFRNIKEGMSIHDFYDFGEEIFSSGCISKVLTATRKLDGSEVVVKMRPKGRDRVSERGWRQIMVNLGRLSGHSHVLDISEILEDVDTYYVVMPRCDGGELFELLATAEEIPERECKRIIREILAAVAHLHKNDLIHRDIKPENILFHSEGNPGDLTSAKTVKLIDFDTVAGWTPQSPKTRTFVGTPGYIAPEVLLGEASPQSDLWSIGVIFYILMTGDSPWSTIATLEDGTVGSPKAQKAYNQMRDEVLNWDEDPWPAFPLARDLCQKLIAFNTKLRLTTAQDALDHPWLQES